MAKKGESVAPDKPKIIPSQVLELARRQWSVVAIAAFFQCDRTTIYRNVPASEIEAAAQSGVARLREALYTRAMGGRTERKLPDGTIEVSYLKSSDRLLQAALDRFEGRCAQTVILNPDPHTPANVKHTIDPEQVKAAIEQLETDY